LGSKKKLCEMTEGKKKGKGGSKSGRRQEQMRSFLIKNFPVNTEDLNLIGMAKEDANIHLTRKKAKRKTSLIGVTGNWKLGGEQ